MNKSLLFTLSLALVCGAAFGADQPAKQPSGQGKTFQVTPQFSAAENTVEELTGTPVSDPDSQARLQQARAVFEAALKEAPDSTLALNFLARTYCFPGQDMATGIATFEKSLALDPDQPDAVSRLVDLYHDTGQPTKAADAQSRYVGPKADPKLAAKVSGMIAQWDGTEAQRLVNQGQAEQGFALFDKAIKETTDAGVQQSLRDARDAVSRDWEITEYNAALERVKAKDYKGAWNILEKLLPVAKVPEVVDRAMRLRAKLEPVIHQDTSE